MYQTSSFLELLRQSEWIPNTSGGFSRPRAVFVRSPRNLLLLDDDVEYTDLEGNEIFLKDLGVRVEPEIEEVLTHLKSYKEKNPLPDGNKITKTAAIYRFFDQKVNAKGLDENARHTQLQQLMEDFHSHALLYLPREDRAWWRPREVFWEDMAGTFDVLRGYVKHHSRPVYGDGLESFLASLGVAREASIGDCLDVLELLKAKGDVEHSHRFLNRLYSLIDNLVNQNGSAAVDWNRPVFLSEGDQWLPPSGLYYCDVEEYRRLFGATVELLWLPFHWDNVACMLREGHFRRLGDYVSIAKRFATLNEVEGDRVKQLIALLGYAKQYLKRKKFALYQDLDREGVFGRINTLKVYDTPQVVLDYALSVDGSEAAAVRGLEREAYYSLDESRLYKSSRVSLLSTAVASEVAKLFGGGEDEAFSVLDSLFGAADDEEELHRKLSYFGVQQASEREEEFPHEVRMVAEAGPEEGDTKQKDSSRQERPNRQKPRLPEEPETEHKRSDLIDPDELIFNAGEEHTPYIKSEGTKEIAPRPISLRREQKGEGRERKQTTLKKRAGRADAESVALEMVSRYEEDIEGRQVEDRHSQLGIGYDIYSSGGDDDERFIEVKHFRGDAGTWVLTPHQWKKAEQELDRYYVFIVSRLQAESTPIIEIIQNPVKYLTPDPPSEKKFSDWKNGIAIVITSQKV